MKLTVNASKLKLAATCMATVDIRYYLCGVRIEPRTEGGVYIVATDGHRMIAVIDETGHVDEPRIVRMSASTFAKLPKIGNKDDWAASVIEVEGSAHLVIKDGSGKIVHLQPNDGDDLFINDAKYPDWRRVLKFKECIELQNIGTFQLQYMSAIQKAISPSKMGLAVRLFGHHHTDGILVQIVNHEYAAMVVMPMRNDVGKNEKWVANFAKVIPGPTRDASVDHALKTAFTALDHLANRGLVQRME